MKTALKILVPILAGSSTASFAGTAGLEQGSNGMLACFFIGFAVMIFLFQAAPAIVMFASMIKGLFSCNPAEASFSPFKGKGEK